MIKKALIFCFIIFISLSCKTDIRENKCNSILKVSTYNNEFNQFKTISIEYNEKKIELSKVNKSVFEVCLDGIQDRDELISDLLLDGLFKIQFGEKREYYSFILSKNDSSDLIIYNPNKIPSTDFDFEKHMKEFDSLNQMIRQKSN